MTTEERIDAALAAAKKRILSDLPVQTGWLYEEMKYNATLRIRSKRKWGCRPPK